MSDRRQHICDIKYTSLEHTQQHKPIDGVYHVLSGEQRYCLLARITLKNNNYNFFSETNRAIIKDTKTLLQKYFAGKNCIYKELDCLKNY